MAEVYRRSTDGGARSERFGAYVDAARDRRPVGGYNPMTSKPVLPTIESLLAIDAEARLADVARRTAERVGFDGDAVVHLTVATPGMWTDRLATEVHHRLTAAADPAEVLWWFDQRVDAAGFDAAVVAQTWRLITDRRHGRPVTLADAVAQEGTALALAGDPGRLDAVAADALDVLGDDEGLPTMVAFLYGDDAARAMGFTPIGLGDHVGYRHATALAHATRTEPGRSTAGSRGGGHGA
jgi:hypothetical protein